jgi:hypothetical protein
MTDQTIKFASRQAAQEFYDREGRALGYGEPYEGCDNWYRCTRVVPCR